MTVMVGGIHATEGCARSVNCSDMFVLFRASDDVREINVDLVDLVEVVRVFLTLSTVTQLGENSNVEAEVLAKVIMREGGKGTV